MQNGNYRIQPQENSSVLYAIFFQYFTMPDIECSKNAETWCNLTFSKISKSGPGSSVGIATGYGLDGPGIEIFRTRPDRPWGPPRLLYNG
jgi:hypothetical protein